MSTCQVCGRQAATKNVTLHQNIGALVMRFSKSLSGEMCRTCIHDTFWKFTPTTLFLGPWGMISLILAPIFIINNTFIYLGSLGMEKPDASAPVTGLTAGAVKALIPYADRIHKRMMRGEPIEEISEAIATLAGVTREQVMTFSQTIREHAASQAATASGLSKKAIDVLTPYTDRIAKRLGRGEAIEKVSSDIAGLTGLSAEEVELFAMSVAKPA